MPLIEAVGTSDGWKPWAQAAGVALHSPSLFVDSYGPALQMAIHGNGVCLVHEVLATAPRGPTGPDHAGARGLADRERKLLPLDKIQDGCGCCVQGLDCSISWARTKARATTVKCGTFNREVFTPSQLKQESAEIRRHFVVFAQGLSGPPGSGWSRWIFSSHRCRRSG